jgi:hypothetical protein
MLDNALFQFTLATFIEQVTKLKKRKEQQVSLALVGFREVPNPEHVEHIISVDAQTRTISRQNL